MDGSTQLSRARIENAIEALVALLDEIDGDPNLGDNGDYEPSLGNSRICTALGIAEDCELDDSNWEPDVDDEPDSDNEPWLSTGTQNWSVGGNCWDLEIPYTGVTQVPTERV